MYNRRASDYSSYRSSHDERESPDKSAIVEEEEESAGDGHPQPLTDIFKAQDLPRSDTPETYLTDLGDKPDITLFCEQCRYFVDLRQIRHHRAYHQALQVLNYKGNNMPESSELLLKKRNAVLRRLKKEATQENPILPKQIQQVNEAYELLKAELEDTFDVCRQIKDAVDTTCRGTALSCSQECVYALGMCSSPNSRWKSEMEDTKIYQDGFGENSNKCYLGLFDGYHGRFTAEVAASLLHKFLLHELMKFDESLALGPKPSFDVDTDISHHSFIFGSSAMLDGQVERKKGVGEESPQQVNSELESKLHKGVSVTIQPDDEDLTKRIIQLCEEKYEKLVEQMPTPITTNSTRRTKTDRSRHPLEDEILQAFSKCYHLLDILLSYGKDECSRVRWSGCSALSMVIESIPQTGELRVPSMVPESSRDNKRRAASKIADPPQEKGFIHLSNSGDTRALLVRGNRPYRLSKDHTPSNLREQDRVIRQGGTISTSEVDSRVNGVLATTRGLGNHGDPELKKCVLVEPHTCSVQIDQYAQFIVMATRGVWEILSDQEVASLLMRMLPDNQIPPPSKPSSSLANLLQSQGPQGTSDTPGSDNAFEFKKVTILETPATGDEGDKKEPESSGEKGAEDAAVTEKKEPDTSRTSRTEEGRKIFADLKTEVGSHFGDVEDPSFSQSGDLDMVTLPVHSRLKLGGQGSQEERRRELARLMAEQLVQAALLAGSRDNITVMVALLPGCGM